MVKEAHENGLQGHPYTLRADTLPNYVNSTEELLNITYNEADVDSAFTDFPDLAVQFLHQKP